MALLVCRCEKQLRERLKYTIQNHQFQRPQRQQNL